MATVTRFEDLEVWQLARELCKSVKAITSKGDFAKDFTLKNQIQASSGSVMDNIAEGFGRAGKKEFIQFLGIANGSANETKSQLHRALDYNYISKEEFEKSYEIADKMSRKIGSFIAYLNSSDVKGEKFRNR